MTNTLISGGSPVTGTHISAGDLLTIESGGSSVKAFVSAGGTELLSAGGIAISSVLSGGSQTVFNGGIASFTTISFGGFEAISTGGSAVSTVMSGGTQTVYSGGHANFTTISFGGSEVVSTSGVTSFTTISYGGSEVVSSGGVANFTTISFGGVEVVKANGTTSFTTVSLGGSETISSGGTGVSTTVVFNAFQVVRSGGLARSTIISSGGTQVVSNGGIASTTTVSYGGEEMVSSGGVTRSTTVLGGGDVTVSSGGTASAIRVQAVAYLNVSKGGTVVSGFVSNGGFLNESGGTASLTTISNGGQETVYSGGRAVSGTLLGSGAEYIELGGHATGTIVSSGAQQYLYSGGVASATVVRAGGKQFVLSGATAVGAIISSGGTEVVSSGAIVSQTTVSSGGHIDVAFLHFVAGATASVNSSTNTLTVSAGGSSYVQVLTGSYAGEFAHALTDGVSGTLVTIDTTAPCYAAGTRIMTRRGDIAVECLAVGDEVALATGGFAGVRWLGHRRVMCARHPRPWDVNPVRVRADAFGPAQPRRDLMLSPDHSVFVDGVLIPVRYLINDVTVIQEPCESIEYWHVELPEHAVLLAEGLACESYLDTGNRAAFANGGTTVMAHPDFARGVWLRQACAPQVVDGPKLAAVHGRLNDRALALGYELTRDSGLHLRCGAETIGTADYGARYRARLPQGASAVQLVSRVWSPANVDPGSNDARRLGVAISRLWLDGRETALTSPGLTSGWHPAEDKWRWTNGDATLAVNGARELTFEVAITGRYWHSAAQPARAARRA